MLSVCGILCNGFGVTDIFSLILLQNFQLITNKIKNCSEILQDLAQDMEIVSKRMTVVQEHHLVTKNATTEDAVSQDK
jgi:hypothetical protein